MDARHIIKDIADTALSALFNQVRAQVMVKLKV